MTSASAPAALSLTSPSDLRVLPVIRALVQLAGEMAGMGEQPVYEAAVAVNEACSNIIHHAHAGQRDPHLQVVCRPHGDGLEVLLRDEGPPFDFDAVPELDPTEIRAGGRGVYLIRRLMDEVVCTQPPSGGNELLLRKRAASASSITSEREP